jgi:hypothetical protein
LRKWLVDPGAPELPSHFLDPQSSVELAVPEGTTSPGRGVLVRSARSIGGDRVRRTPPGSAYVLPWTTPIARSARRLRRGTGTNERFNRADSGSDHRHGRQRTLAPGKTSLSNLRDIASRNRDLFSPPEGLGPVALPHHMNRQRVRAVRYGDETTFHRCDSQTEKSAQVCRTVIRKRHSDVRATSHRCGRHWFVAMTGRKESR